MPCWLWSAACTGRLVCMPRSCVPQSSSVACPRCSPVPLPPKLVTLCAYIYIYRASCGFCCTMSMGQITLEVVSIISDTELLARPLNSKKLGERKNCNLPGTTAPPLDAGWWLECLNWGHGRMAPATTTASSRACAWRTFLIHLSQPLPSRPWQRRAVTPLPSPHIMGAGLCRETAAAA